MINNINTMLPPAINLLKNSSFTFYPTGSRFFGGNVEASADWDFFAEDCDVIRVFLVKHGFSIGSPTDYGSDTMITAVYSYHGTLDSDKGLVKIDVQLIADKHMSAKLMIQKLLKSYFGENGIPGDKINKSVFWDFTYQTLKTLSIV